MLPNNNPSIKPVSLLRPIQQPAQMPFMATTDYGGLVEEMEDVN